MSDTVMASSSALTAAWKGAVSPEDRPMASNMWIMGPGKTTDGSTIMNNGPQFGWFNPNYVFGIGLHGAGFDVTGNTPFGYPAVLFGTNGNISWGSTAGPLDVNDMYQEKLNPADASQYLYNGAYQPMTQRVEVIKVKGEADRTLQIQSTVHGTVTSMDAANGTAYSMKRSWDGYEIESLLGWIHMAQAQNWDQFLVQASRVAITINWYYADNKGNIGYVSPGRLPIRPANQDIRLPALGDGSMEWLGIKPFSEVPKVYNPPQGYIINWNNQSAPGAVSDFGNYSVVHRVNEFITRIEAKPKLTPDEIWDLARQTSFADTNARYFVPYIVAATSALPPTDPSYQAAQILANWSGLNTDPTDSGFYSEAGATIMRTWLPIMYTKLLADDLPASVLASLTSTGYPTSPPTGSVNAGAGSKLLYNALLGSKAGVPQTYDFFNGADKFAMIRSALADTVTQLSAKYGADPSKWLTPVVAHKFVTSNFMGYPQANADEVLTLPTFMNRGTENDQITFSAAGSAKMCTAAPPGQSGFVSQDGQKSKHYDDQMSLYKSFGCKSEWLNAQDVDAHLESSRTLSY
jgi:penicillin amidase